ncbi:hypothetical protein [Nocardioides lijunqiniae]|uniref:hypothetical protein n=1 Tax=Nocardioides lijunqiniae TaxID=2760832 RepID=UPI0018786462|nr:hypothetical protein [Nocardioides lijunqiniae]
MLPRTTTTVAVALAAPLLALLLTGCGADPDRAGAVPTGSSPTGAPTAAPVTAGPGFAPATPPPPAGTFTPSPGSWDGVAPEPGYRVVLLTTEEDAATRVLSDAVRAWAEEVDADLKVIEADEPHAYVDRIQESVDEAADLVVTTGEGLVDALALVTASHLDRPFLLVGAELAEPTANVTAADWTGAAFRGEGLGRPATHDPASFTPERAARAVRAGVTAVLTGHSGTVVWLD